MKIFTVSALLLLVLASPAESVWAQGDSAAESRRPAGPADPDESLFHRDPLPEGPVSLIGGTVQEMDRVRNRIRVKVTGGGTRTIAFDDRTSVLRDGQAVTYDKIRKGDRVYVDTVLYQQKVFARGVRIHSQTGTADARGQITAFDPGSGAMSLLDELSGVPVEFRVDSSTQVRTDKGAARLTDLIPGALVTVQFVPDSQALGKASEVTILARPGSDFVFAGTVTNIDLKTGVFSVANKSDEKNYDLMFDPTQVRDLPRLKIGSEVVVSAVFGGEGYRARGINILSSPEAR